MCSDNYSLKYHNYCKYHNIHLVDYNSAVKLKLQAYTKSHFLYKHQPCLYTNLNSFYCPSYAWSTVLLFQYAFCQPSKITTGGMAPMKALIWQCRPDTLPLSVHIFQDLVIETFVHVNVIATPNSAICIVWLLCYSCCHHPPHLHVIPTHPYICWSNTDAFLETNT